MGDWDSDERILIQGIIDAFFEEDGKLVLVDYKTDYVENSDILIRRYEAQVRYYTRALEQMTGKGWRSATCIRSGLGRLKCKAVILGTDRHVRSRSYFQSIRRDMRRRRI
ncbi:MAG: hypothetical protein ACLR8P_02715 [Clostridium fessum]